MSNTAAPIPTFEDVGFLSPTLSAFREEARRNQSDVFALVDCLNHLAMRMLYELPTESINDSDALVLAAYARGLEAFQSAIRLVECGAVVEGKALVRIATEAVITVAALGADPQSAKSFEHDDAKHHQAFADKLINHSGATAAAKENADLQAVLQAINERYPDQSPKRIDWGKLAAGAEVEYFYDTLYRMCSTEAHVTLKSLYRHIDRHPDGTVAGFRFEPDRSDELRLTLYLASSTLMKLVGLMRGLFDLAQFQADIDSCAKLFAEIKLGPEAEDLD
jgi:hypothetical protein